MDNPRDDATNEQYRTRGAFTIAAVRSDSDTKGMETNFVAAHLALKNKWRELEDLDELLEESDAVVVLADRRVDKLVRSLELRVLDLVSKDRNDPRYRRYFPDGLRAVTEADARTVEPKMVREIIKTLDEDQSKPGLADLHGDLRGALVAAVEAVEAADTECKQCEERISFEKNKTLVEAKLRWVEERKKLHADLIKMFPHDPARVESYFRSFAKPRKKKTG